jgi:hypothetical protein
MMNPMIHITSSIQRNTAVASNEKQMNRFAAPPHGSWSGGGSLSRIYL